MTRLLSFPFRFRRPRLGLALEKREYDLPFHDDRANRFLVLLISLMTFLSVLSAAGGAALSAMAEKWSHGLANHLTVEIPALDSGGARLSPQQLQDLTEKIRTVMLRQPGIESVTVQGPSDVGKLVEPWLGNSQALLDQVPLPVLINVKTETNTIINYTDLQREVKKTSATARLETHQSWLADLLRFTETLSFAAYLIGFLTAITTISAVAGAVRARMAAHQEQLEILHLIGASDEYITRQFQKHAFSLSLLGAVLGGGAALFSLGLIDWLAGHITMSLLPSFSISKQALGLLLSIPLIGCLITVLTTRITVLQSLKEMP